MELYNILLPVNVLFLHLFLKSMHIEFSRFGWLLVFKFSSHLSGKVTGSFLFCDISGCDSSHFTAIAIVQTLERFWCCHVVKVSMATWVKRSPNAWVTQCVSSLQRWLSQVGYHAPLNRFCTGNRTVFCLALLAWALCAKTLAFLLINWMHTTPGCIY